MGAAHPRSATTTTHHALAPKTPRELAAVSLGALGVVYGDIGTSPLYAINECTGPHGVPPTPENIIGILSLVFWSLVLVICIKYLVFVLRADNKGEGGILSLAALVAGKEASRGRIIVPVLLALFGAGLLFGEGMITPAISILGAMEGLGVATHKLEPLIVPITTGILIALFWVQRWGTERIGSVFGWVMLVWFLSIAAAGIPAILREPRVLAAINPLNAVVFFQHNGYHGFLTLGSVVLVITGGEALYADMGHFGKKPIRLAWFSMVLPCVLLSYFGQGALVLHEAPQRVPNTFYGLVDGTPFLYPMVVLATMAAIVASQALISGVYSITRQAMLLGFSPRVSVIHTSAGTEGQIYIPEINWILMVGCIALVLGFQTSSNLAAAYGIAVTGTMAITSFLFSRVARKRFQWSFARATSFLVLFIAIDLVFFSANLHKLSSGGWLPLAIGSGLFIIATTWWRGRTELSKAIGDFSLPDEVFLLDLEENKMVRVSGTAVFMTSTQTGIPQVLLHHVKHNKVLHKQVVLLSIETVAVPWVPGNDSLDVDEMKQGFWRVHARVGFMQEPRVPRILKRCEDRGLDVGGDVTYYLGRQTLLVSGRSRMAKWRKSLFSFLSRNSRPPTAFFDLPPNRVVELGMQIEL